MKHKPNKKHAAILARPKPAIGTYPGQNRSRKFRDRKRHANRTACRGRYRGE